MLCIKQQYPEFNDYIYVAELANKPNDKIIAVETHGGRKHTTMRCEECNANHVYIGEDTSVWPQQAALGWQ